MKNFKKWAKAAGIRAVKTVAQTAVGVIGASALVSEVNWLTVVSAAALAGVVSLLTSVAGLPECKDCAEGAPHEHDAYEADGKLYVVYTAVVDKNNRRGAVISVIDL